MCYRYVAKMSTLITYVVHKIVICACEVWIYRKKCSCKVKDQVPKMANYTFPWGATEVTIKTGKIYIYLHEVFWKTVFFSTICEKYVIMRSK